MSELPDGLGGGEMRLFADDRIKWLGGIVDLAGMSVLELGPLEGGHSYMLELAGARRVVAVEANRRAFLRCLVVKEVYGLRSVEFLLGDLVEYLRRTEKTFDLCVASGVLYHMLDPVEMLRLAARVSDRLFLWTHYYDVDRIRANPAIAAHFPSEEGPPFRYEYAAEDHLGASRGFSHWLNRATIIGLLDELGFDRVEVGIEQPDHPNGPAFALVALRE